MLNGGADGLGALKLKIAGSIPEGVIIIIVPAAPGLVVGSVYSGTYF